MTALISDCGRYRYTLDREWMMGEGTCLFVMLNPSTADAIEDDPTIGRCIKFAQRWGFQRLEVVNLFALRSTDPNGLLTADDPVGPLNDHTLEGALIAAGQAIAAWGASVRKITNRRQAEVLSMCKRLGTQLDCLGTTEEGFPRHPLARGKHRVPDDFEPVPFVYYALGASR
jgi:hypothetical protein